MIQKENLKNIYGLIQKIAEEDTLILVEGRKDKAALAQLGITNTIAITRTPLFKIIETVSAKYKRCIILTDLDAEGKKWYGKLKQGLSEHGVQVDDTFRNMLFKDTELRQIEGLKNYLERRIVPSDLS